MTILQAYQKKLARSRRRVRLTQLSLLLAFFISWEIAAHTAFIDPLLFSSPSRVIQLILQQGTSIFVHISVTVLETIAGFLLGTVGGIIIATILWSNTFIARVSDPFLVVLNSMPKVALGPIVIVAFGPSFAAIIAMGALISIIITTMVVFQAFNQVDQNYLTVVRSFGASKWQSFRHVIFPATHQTIMATLKVNVGLSWVGVIVGEFLVSKQGLGYLIIYGFQVFNFTLVMMSLFFIAIFATIMYRIVLFIEKKVVGTVS
ncbi:ABC transporter permease [Paenalkalicoccus suaedae]|uniref:ABC transporter permease n=1 Tax=Paenalkalicoccus suaedae TaxID=2592382 RepID=A0A859FGH0_9BACI|nr:ABC transporter permease [Paenalkalicoccus suaedae]QKS72131.1 ABC transporter permease [Paenalkalicoccus suaedae]